jgi:putative ABC transport system permease protein
VLANIIAAPVAYYLANRWLENFAYRIELGWVQFFIAGCLTVIIALTTVCYQAVKAARTNPVEVLKCE